MSGVFLGGKLVINVPKNSRNYPQNAKNEYSSGPDTFPIAMNVDKVENDVFMNFFVRVGVFGVLGGKFRYEKQV